MKKWVAAVAAVSAVGVLVYWQWDPIWAFVFSPVGGFVAKILLTTKVLKVVAAVVLAGVAGVAAMWKKRQPEPEYAPPVYGPPEELTSTGTATATTTEPVTVPASRPI